MGARGQPGLLRQIDYSRWGILTGTAIKARITPHECQMFEAIFHSVGAGTPLYIATLDITAQFEFSSDR